MQSLGAMRVLVVDDEPSIVNLLRRLFTRSGCEVLACSSAEEALVASERFTPDLVISDFRLGGLDGAELLDRMAVRFPASKRVLLSGYAECHRAVNGIFAPKPYDPDQLLALCGL